MNFCDIMKLDKLYIKKVPRYSHKYYYYCLNNIYLKVTIQSAFQNRKNIIDVIGGSKHGTFVSILEVIKFTTCFTRANKIMYLCS